MAAHQKAVDIAAAAYGSDSGQVLMHRNNLSIVLSANGQSDKAISEFQEIVNIREHLNGEDSLAVGEVLQNLASEQSASGMLDDALISLERAERIFKEKLPEESPRRAFPALTRSAVLLELERYDAAEAAAREAFGTLSRTLPEGHYATEIARCRMGLAELGIGNREAAHPFLPRPVGTGKPAGSSSGLCGRLQGSWAHAWNSGTGIGSARLICVMKSRGRSGAVDFCRKAG